MWTIFTLADLWGVSPDSIEYLLETGKLQGARDANGDWVVSNAALDRYLNKQRCTKGASRGR
jgi:hypothetical protein